MAGCDGCRAAGLIQVAGGAGIPADLEILVQRLGLGSFEIVQWPSNVLPLRA